MNPRIFARWRAAAALAALVAPTICCGCSTNAPAPGSERSAGGGVAPPELAHRANQLFLSQKSFDPWTLQSTNSNQTVNAYIPEAKDGVVCGPDGYVTAMYFAGKYDGGRIVSKSGTRSSHGPLGKAPANYIQSLNMRDGVFTTRDGSRSSMVMANTSEPWPKFWSDSDIVIAGDPEAQQVTHADMFYLAGSASPDHSIPPMGLSSAIYGGHIFWDAEIWMFPALIAQHPNLASGIIDYRFKTLRQARANAASHGFKGAEYPWESAATGKEEAPTEFAKERHITADVAFAAWQYYLWTGDKQALKSRIWPILQACADYWVSRASKASDGSYHIKGVIGPDETSGVVDDDAWTNSVVGETLRDAALAASEAGESADPAWAMEAEHMTVPKDPKTGVPIEHAAATDKLMAKQADSQLLIYPLNEPMSPAAAAATLDFCRAHTIATGPAMTDSINAIIAARLDRGGQSLDLFRASYRPFMRGPWDAFSEKRTTNNVYFCTGMGGCLQTVLYGFAGLNVSEPRATGLGRLIASAGGVGLYANPHVPPGWTGLTVKGVCFRGHVYDIAIDAANKVMAVKRS